MTLKRFERNQLTSQTQRLLQHLNNERMCQEESNQLLSEILGHPLDDTTKIYTPFYADIGRNISFGKNVLIERNVTLSDYDKITIGDDVEIGSGSSLLTTSFKMNDLNEPERVEAPIVIEENVKIGSCVIILPGVKIGKNSIVEAGSLVENNLAAKSYFKNNK